MKLNNCSYLNYFNLSLTVFTCLMQLLIDMERYRAQLINNQVCFECWVQAYKFRKLEIYYGYPNKFG